MAKIDRLKPGQVLYSVSSGRMGNTAMRTMRVHSVVIVSIDLEKRTVVARWNSNPATTFTERSVSKWRVNKPMMVGSGIGAKRLATREEIAKAKGEA